LSPLIVHWGSLKAVATALSSAYYNLVREKVLRYIPEQGLMRVKTIEASAGLGKSRREPLQ
jgi:hypothetical protein